MYEKANKKTNKKLYHCEGISPIHSDVEADVAAGSNVAHRPDPMEIPYPNKKQYTILYTMRTTPDIRFRDASSIIPEAIVYPGKRITMAPKEIGAKQKPCLQGAGYKKPLVSCKF